MNSWTIIAIQFPIVTSFVSSTAIIVIILQQHGHGPFLPVTMWPTTQLLETSFIWSCLHLVLSRTSVPKCLRIIPSSTTTWPPTSPLVPPCGCTPLTPLHFRATISTTPIWPSSSLRQWAAHLSTCPILGGDLVMQPKSKWALAFSIFLTEMVVLLLLSSLGLVLPIAMMLPGLSFLLFNSSFSSLVLLSFWDLSESVSLPVQTQGTQKKNTKRKRDTVKE